MKHVAKPRTRALLDHVECSCGWRSRTYFDGREYAWAEWERHASDSGSGPEGGDGTAPAESPQSGDAKGSASPNTGGEQSNVR